MADSERRYVELLFQASKKYASWDPEVPVEVGDWGRITRGSTGFAFWRRRGIFLKEGNIYQDGKAKKYGIPPPVEHGTGASEGVTWVVSQDAQEWDALLTAGGDAPVLANCQVKAGFRFTSNFGAILAMSNDTVSTIDPPGSLRRLLKEEGMRNCVLVSEVHRTSSYARFLATEKGGSVAIGLRMEPPVPQVASLSSDVHWVRSSTAGNFKSKVNKNGHRDFCPLFRLVSFKEQTTSVGFRGKAPPLPDAVPPWLERPDTSRSTNASIMKRLLVTFALAVVASGVWFVVQQ